MKLNKFTVILAVLFVSIMAIGAVSAESVDDFGSVAATDGDIQGSVDVIDAADDLGTADTADETVGDDSGSPDDTVSYDLDDDTYSKYFNEDGTATDALSADGNYYLNVGTLTNKDIKIVSGQNVYIQGKDGTGIIKNGTITIGNGAEKIESVQISGITFINYNKDGICVNPYSENIAIARNNFNLTYDATYGALDYASPMAIVSYGYVNGITIVGNNISMKSAAMYTYGIDLTIYTPHWGPQGETNPNDIYIADNDISIDSSSASGMGEGMYLDSLTNAVIENNKIYVHTVGDAANYGMQLSDSCAFNYMGDDEAISPFNVTIKDNTVVLDSNDMAYGITAISAGPFDANYQQYVRDIVISGNDVTVTSAKGAIGIGTSSYDSAIVANKITVSADASAVNNARADDYFGSESNAIYVNNYNAMNGYFYNNTVTDNVIVSNVPAIRINKTEGNEYNTVEPLVIGNNIYVLNDDTYATYFNDDGTAKDSLDPMGNYTLSVGTLNNKDMIIGSGSYIYIIANEDEGKINNGAITIGDGAGSAGSIFINGLTFTNFNKNPIVINPYTADVSISDNIFDLTYDDTEIQWPDPSPMGISTNGYVDDIRILGNIINISSASRYTYGIDLTNPSVSNAEHFLVASNTIYIVSTATTGAAEGLYLDTIANSEISNNHITVVTKNAGVANYAMQVADSSEWVGIKSPYNVTIEENIIVIDSADMVYGITVISTDTSENSKNFIISDNDISIVSATGAIAIGSVSSDVTIEGNTISLSADPTKEVTVGYVDTFFGDISYGIFVNNTDGTVFFKNSTVTGNTITSNVQAIKVAEEENEAVKPLVIEDNEVKTSYYIYDDNFATYFNEDGTIKDDAPISDNDILVLGDLTNKKLVISMPLTINAAPNKKLVNSTIKVIASADGTVIDGLTIECTGLSSGVITLVDVNNVEITNNKIIVPSTTKTVYGIFIDSGENGCNNISINNNLINITGSRYVYGIDIWQDYGLENKHNNIRIFENEFFITGTGEKMAEGIFVSNCNDVIIDGNNINVGCVSPAYGIGTNWLFGAVITNNHITVGSDSMAYGITATTSGSDLIVRANDIDAVGVGAVGIGINNQTGATIEDNTIAIDGGDYTSITVSDSLGTANAGILVGEGNTNVEMSGNDVTEVSALRLDTVIEVSDLTVTAAPSGNGSLQITLKTKSGMLLANQVVKVVFNSQMYELTTDANGVAVFSFPLNKAGTYNVDVFYLGDDDYRGSDASAKITINKVKTALTASGKTFLATATTKKLTATLKDAKGNPLAKKTVTFTVNGKTYKATTNANGVATVKLALKAAKTYKVSIKFAGDSVYAASTKSVNVKLNKEKTKITAPKKTFKRTAKTKKVVITLKNSKNKAVAGKKITLTVNKKKYTVKTNKKGQATFKVKLTKKGTFKYTVKFAGDTQYKAVTKKTGKIVIK